jgi:hypothetical protein
MPKMGDHMKKIQLGRLTGIAVIVLFSSLSASNEEQELTKYILEQARLNIPASIATCESHECIENALHQEEHDALDKYLRKCDIPADDRLSLHSTWKHLTKMLPPRLFNTEQKQDVKSLGIERIQKTREYLKKSDINPDGIEIIMDDKNCKKTGNIAYSYLLYHNNSIPPRIAYHNGDVMDHTIAHEVTHLAELHGPKKEFIYHQTGGKNMDKWRRTQEMQAELLPLLRFKDKKLIDHVINKHMPQCIQDHEDGILPYKWNDSVNLGFPDCSKLLPYVAKIQELNKF